MLLGRLGTRTGTVVAGRYELLRQIGAGGMGQVWLVRDRSTRTLVAGKVLGQHDAEALLRFVREQSVRVRHPHVVAPVSWAAEDDRVLFTMDLVRGGTADDLLRERGPLPADWVARVLGQLLAALGACHAAGVVHRDVKTANLLLEPGPACVRLADFGVATVLGDVRLTRSPIPVGTPGYLAPEVLAGAEPAIAQDLYAAGVTALRLLTGLPAEQAARHQADGPLGVLLARLVASDPLDRPADATAALALLPALPRTQEVIVPDRVGDPPRDWGAAVALACFAGALVLSLVAAAWALSG